MDNLGRFFLLMLVMVGISLIITSIIVFGLNLYTSAFWPWFCVVFFAVCLFFTLS